MQRSDSRQQQCDPAHREREQAQPEQAAEYGYFGAVTKNSAEKKGEEVKKDGP